MARVIIQPSFGNRVAREHWRDTLDVDVSFLQGGLRGALTESQFDSLAELHPSGAARFWGAQGHHDKRMAEVAIGDVVLFTGQKHVKAIGEVGYSFQNKAFADLLWNPDPKNGSWRNVYSLLSFVEVAIPYEEIWELPSFNYNDNFMGTRFLVGEKADEILVGLGIETAVSRRDAVLKERVVADTILAGSQILSLEGMHTQEASYGRPAGTVVVRRGESLLVKEFSTMLATQGVDVKRIKTVTGGITDLYVADTFKIEIVEAKGGVGHPYVRQALAQLLDYAPHGLEPVTHLAALFPSKPEASDVKLLHRYGIDCVFRTSPNSFERLDAPEERRVAMRAIWSAA